MTYKIPKLPLELDVETKSVLRQLNEANKKLAELKGVALTIPNENILINTLVLQEAKDSSAVENIVTTHDDLYKADLDLRGISKLMQDYKFKARELLKKSYSHELLNNLFSHPYTKIEFVMADVGVTRLTATSYLDKLVQAKLLEKLKSGRYNYYLNIPLINLLMNNSADLRHKDVEQIESVNE